MKHITRSAARSSRDATSVPKHAESDTPRLKEELTAGAAASGGTPGVTCAGTGAAGAAAAPLAQVGV